jgi:hypothetical protein
MHLAHYRRTLWCIRRVRILYDFTLNMNCFGKANPSSFLKPRAGALS